MFLATHQLGPKLSYPKIAKHIKSSLSTVKFWMKRYEETGGVEELQACGRPSVISEKKEGIIDALVAKDPDATSPTIAAKLKRRNIVVSARTVRRKLNASGHVFGNTMSKPLLSEQHCQKRLKWAKTNMSRDWEQVLFTDEATINAGVRRKKVWHRPGRKMVIRTVKHPIRVHIWGCVSSRGFGRCYVFKENLNAKKLLEIYDKALLPSIHDLFGDVGECVLQEDNDPKHTSKIAAKWREDIGLTRMPWPAQSPDQNCIENVWHVLKVRVSNRHPRDIKELVRAIKSEWASLSMEYAEKLVGSMPRRVQALLDAQGDYTMF